MEKFARGLNRVLMSNKNNLLAFFAHPDDETMLAGGTLALLSKIGFNVYYLCATRGEGGEVGKPPVCTLSELGNVRENEFLCAVNKLGGKQADILGYIDPRVGEDDQLFPFEVEDEKFISQIISYIEQNDISAIVTHGSSGEYGHPAHRLVHETSLKALKALKKDDFIMYTVQASFNDHPKKRLMNVNDAADLVIDISPVMEQKIEATYCHKTQHDLFVRRKSRELGYKVTIPEITLNVESLHRFYPKSNNYDQDIVFNRLIESGHVINVTGS